MCEGRYRLDENGRTLCNTASFREAAKNGTRGAFKIDTKCAECGENCMADFGGNLVFAIGLNNALKAHNYSFRTQNVSDLVDNLIATVDELLPNYRTMYFVRPLEVPVWKNDPNADKNFSTYHDLNKKV